MFEENEEPLYTAEDTFTPPDLTVGDYSIAKGIATVATGNTNIADEVNFDQLVDDSWRTTVPESNEIDKLTAINAATSGQVSVVEEALASIAERNRLYGETSARNAETIRTKLRELSQRAAENVSIRNPSVLFNNDPQKLAQVTDEVANAITAQAVMERAVKDGSKISNIVTGFGFEFLPFAAEQGAAIDRVAIKYGVPEQAISRTTGRSETRSWLQAKFDSLPEEEKGQWLDNLYTDLQDGFFISDWQAALLIQDIVSGREQTWGGWEDWLDRLGVVGAVVTGAGALLKSFNLFKGASRISTMGRNIAKAGGKDALVAAEAAKVTTAVANKQRLQAAGVVAGELTGINTAIDLAKLVSLNAAKVLPETITTAASDLQKVIRAPVEKLIGELQDVVTGKGIRSGEAAAELEELQRYYSKANNPNIHSVDNFTVSADATAITGKVYYKPENATTFLTQDAANSFIKSFDPNNKLNLKVVPDTTNTGFLVEESVKAELKAREAAIQAQILEQLAAAKKPRKASKRAVEPPKAVGEGVGSLPPPKALETAKPKWKTSSVEFANPIDKAAYQLGSKTKASKSDVEIADWLVKQTGWSKEQIKGHANTIREYIKNNEIVDEAGNINIPDLVPDSRPMSASFNLADQAAAIDGIIKDKSITTIGNVSVQEGVPQKLVFEFTDKLGAALGMQRKVVVLSKNSLLKSGNVYLTSIYKKVATKVDAGAYYFPLGDTHVIVMMQDIGTGAGKMNFQKYLESFAHEYGHAFETEFGTKYFGIMNASFNKWLRAKGIKYSGEGIHKKVLEKFPPEALIEYRSITAAEDIAVFVEKWMNGDVTDFKYYQAAVHEWASMYSEFFAEQFAKWAFSDAVPTDILGQAFKKLVDGFKLIANKVIDTMRRNGIAIDSLAADKNISAMLNQHIKMLKEDAKASKALEGVIAKASKTVKPSLESLNKELLDVQSQLKAIDDAEKGLVHGWLVEQPINRKLDYSIIGKYTDEDINSAARFALGDWALSTSSELYAQRLTGIHQQSRYQKLLTEFVRPHVEKLKRNEMVALNDALVLGDKEGKVFTETELAGQGLTSNARNAYYRVRALRDVMWQMRNDVAAKSLTKRGFVELSTGMKFDDGSGRFFGKETTPAEGRFIYLADEGTTRRYSAAFEEEATKKGYVFFEAAEPILIGGKYRKTFAIPKEAYASNKITEVIPYRAGEYRRIYTDEYFIKIKSMMDVDGEMVEVVNTHRTAASIADANAYVKAFNELASLHASGKLTSLEAARLMQPFGWQPEDIMKALDDGAFGNEFKLEVKYTRTDDDYVNETMGISHSFGSKRGDKVLSVHGSDTVNTLSPMDSIAAEIGNTAYVASVTEWRESHVIRWFNTFSDDLPENVKQMTPDQAFAYMLNNKGIYTGQNKRLQVAEKVQDYIVAQMNIPTKEEKEYLGFMRLLSESVEGKAAGIKPVAKFGAALRATKDYPTWARTIAFHSFFAFNPVQFFMQGMNAFNAVAISPVHGMRAAKSGAMYGLALFSDQESIWRGVAKANKLTNLGLGMDEDEFVEVVRAIRRTGLMDGINTNSLYGAETGKYGLFNGLRRKAGNTSAVFFNSGEGYARLVSFDISRREFIAKNPGVAWWTDDSLTKILERQDDLTQNMTRANVASWQQGWKSIPAQFVQYQVKLMMNIIQSLLGSSRAFTQPEALRLLLAHTAVMGTAGAFLWPFRDLLTDMLPEDMSENTRLTIQQGVVAGMIGAITDGEAKLAIGSRFNTFAYYEDVVKGILDPERSFLEVLGGPSGFAALRILGGFGEALSIVTKAPLTMDTLQIALTEIGKSSFSAINNVQKARIAMANYNQVVSGSGGAMFRVTDTEAWMMAFGIPPAAQEDLSIMYESRKAHNDDVKSAAKAVGKHALLAMNALRAGDKDGHETHWAVVRAILNSYDGADLQQLYREAYKVEAFTQYEKLLVDQAVKDWQVKDLVINTGEQ